MDNGKMAAFDKMKDSPGIRSLKKAVARQEKCRVCKNECCPNHPEHYVHKGDRIYQWCAECFEVTERIIQSSGTAVCVGCEARRLQEMEDNNDR